MIDEYFSIAEKKLLEYKLSSFHSIHSDGELIESCFIAFILNFFNFIDDDTEAATSELIRELEIEARDKVKKRRSHSIPHADGRKIHPPSFCTGQIYLATCL